MVPRKRCLLVTAFIAMMATHQTRAVDNFLNIGKFLGLAPQAQAQAFKEVDQFEDYDQLEPQQEGSCDKWPIVFNATTSEIVQNHVDANGRYLSNQNCTWLIVVPPPKIIRFTFSQLDIESCSWTVFPGYGGCTCDYVSIHNGNSESAPLITKQCGKMVPKESFTTSDNVAFVKFSSDRTHEWSGFSIKYEAIDADNIPCTQLMAISGRKYGTVKSYTCSSSKTYRSNEDCKWRISVDSGHVIRFTFKVLNVQECPNCECDSVSIYDGVSYYDYATLAKRCDNGTSKNFSYVTTTNQAFIHFKTDSDIQDIGFVLEYQQETEADNSPCTSTLATTNTSGIIQNYRRSSDGKYRSNEECGWIVQNRNNDMVIRLQVTFLDVEQCDDDQLDCSCDSLHIYGGRSRILLGTLCGSKGETNVVYQAESVIFLHFTTDRAVEKTGFVASYEAIHSDDLPCNNLTTVEVDNSKTTHSVKSPRRKTGQYRPNEICDWQFMSKGTPLKIDIIFVDFDHCNVSNECGCDFLTIYDGTLPQSDNLLRKLCGKLDCTGNSSSSEEPDECSTLRITGNSTYVRFRTDNATYKSGSGFELRVSADFPYNEGDQGASPSTGNSEVGKPNSGSTGNLYDSTVIVAAIAALVCVVTFLVVGGVYWKSLRRRNRPSDRRASSRFDDPTGNYHYITPSSSFRSIVSESGSDELGEMVERLEITASSIEIGHQIGEGNFGVVHYGLLKKPNEKEQEVAIKAIKSTDSSCIIAFLKEALIMQNMDHANILRLIGITVIEEQPFIVVAYMENGNLRNYLRQNEDELQDATLVQFCTQICRGMSYLSKQKLVHRDLACRNILVDGEGVLKIADFGLARDLHESSYYYYWSSANPRPLPVRWHPPESILQRAFEERSDVWSFGIVCWEIFTKCSTEPYCGLTNEEVIDFVCIQGQRLQRPDHCPDSMYDDVMVRCWNSDRNERPSFDELLLVLTSSIVTPANR